MTTGSPADIIRVSNRRPEKDGKLDGRAGELKMDWTKPLHETVITFAADRVWPVSTCAPQGGNRKSGGPSANLDFRTTKNYSTARSGCLKTGRFIIPNYQRFQAFMWRRALGQPLPDTAKRAG
jgi:hypothetical protein